jgi:hypothetical protein
MNSERQCTSDAAEHIGVVIVHGVADAEQGANLDTLVNTMTASPNCGFKVDSYDEIYRLTDDPLDRLPDDPIDKVPDNPKTGEKPRGRPMIVRHGSIDQANVTFAEVYWADTTRVNTGKFAALMAAFRIVLEAHYFIDALIDRSPRKWRRAWVLARKCRFADARALGWRAADLLALLLHLATGFIRGPIAGVNIALLSISATYLYGQSILQLADTQRMCPLLAAPPNPKCVIMPLDFAILLMLCALVYALWRIFRRSRAAGDIAALEVSACATVGIAIAVVAFAIAIGYHRPSPLTDVEASYYATWMFAFLTWLWTVFAGLVIVAFFVVVWIAARTADSRIRRASWLALALVILQASLWSLFISAPSVPLLALGKLTGSLSPKVQEVAYGFALNYLGIVLVGCIAGWVMWTRSRAASGYGNSKADPKKKLCEVRKEQVPLQEIAKSVPRLIMNRKILIAIIAAGLGALILPFVLLMWHGSMGALLKDHFYPSLFVASLVTAMALLLYLRIDTKTSVNFIHIARDLIDHHYRPRLSFVHFLLPIEHRNALRYPRRQRLLSRVESAVKFLEEEGCRAILFVAHSQGSIIVFEYLKNLRSAAEGSAHTRAVVTFGAPLDHLYAHYFHDYANVGETLGRLQRCVASWTNLHRIDDPIGNSIVGSDGWMTDIAMGKGGHTNYWKETAVAQVIEKSLNRLATERPH